MKYKLKYNTPEEALRDFAIHNITPENYTLDLNCIEYFFKRQLNKEGFENAALYVRLCIDHGLEDTTDLCYTSRTYNITERGQYYGDCIQWTVDNCGIERLNLWINERGADSALHYAVLVYMALKLEDFINYCFEEVEEN